MVGGIRTRDTFWSLNISPFKAEGITRVLSETHANQAKGALRTVKKMFADRLRANKDKTWVEIMEASVKRH